jgi:CBS domain-containing protein
MESLVTVADIASGDLVSVPPDASHEEARSLLLRHGIDQAPIADPRITRSISLADLQADTELGAVDVARPIEAVDVVSDSASLAAVLPRFQERHSLYVIGSDHVSGIVTRADLQLAPVSMAVLGAVLSLEQALSLLIDWYSHGAWLELLSEKRRDELEKRWVQRQQVNADLSRLECMDLVDRFELLRKLNDLSTALGFANGKEIKSFKRQLIDLRNPLAHGGGLLTNLSDLDETLSVIDRVLDLSDRAWSLVADSTFVWDAYLATEIRIVDHPHVEKVRGATEGEGHSLPWPSTIYVVSAANPDGRRRGENVNKQRSTELVEAIDRRKWRWWHAEGSSQSGDWSEESVALETPDLDGVLDLGRDFGQRAIFELTETEFRVVDCADGSVRRAAPLECEPPDLTRPARTH